MQPILIGGEWRQGAGAPIVSTYPADGSVNAEVSSATPEDVDRAVRAGAKAASDPAWRDLKPHERARFLYRIADMIAARAEDLAKLQTRDNGKPIGETRALVASASGTFRYFGAVCETMEDTITPSRGPFITMSVHEPMGVVAAITPWNSPIASDAQKLAPALAGGNAVMLKPSHVTPLVALELGRICLEAGLPPGLVSILPGSGGVVGDAMVRHPLVKKVAFTGGTTTGREIARIAAEKLMPVSLELGGKSPTIVFADADLDHAVNGVIFGIFSSSGESCIAGSRLFVERKIYDAFLDKLVAKTRALKVGDPVDPATHMGPLVSQDHRTRIEGYVDLGRKEGGEVLCGGMRPAGKALEKGSFYLPTVFAGLNNRARISQEEIFGPVLIVIPFDNEDDLISQANDTVYGLACGIWSTNFKRAWRVARRIEAGTVWINTYKLFSISTPFGGFKESGLGREKGRAGMLQYMNQKSLYWGTNEAPMPWAD